MYDEKLEIEGFKIRLLRGNETRTTLKVFKSGEILIVTTGEASNEYIRNFVIQNKTYIEKELAKIDKAKKKWENLPPFTDDRIDELKRQAREYIPKRVEYYAKIMGLKYNKINIRLNKSNWGSCSSNSNLCYNCLLILAPEEVIDYLVVHELSHLVHMDHSKAFWSLVESVIPNYKECENWLKYYGVNLMQIVFKKK